MGKKSPKPGASKKPTRPEAAPKGAKTGPKPPGASAAAPEPAPVAPHLTGIDGIHLSPRDRVALYAAARYLPVGVERACKLKIPFTTYFKDPAVAEAFPELAFDEEFEVDWEPGLTDGPTSARFAVVDYNADTGHLAPPATWDEPKQAFFHDGVKMTKEQVAVLQFHQVSVWALVQRALAFFENSAGLGRRIPWAFEGNRLTVVPHAGYGENAFYDRKSKSLQFYYFTRGERTVYTCLSSDIVNHEFGHAVLDGVRPYFNESVQVETGAFHEFMGDLSAILLSLQNKEFRKRLLKGVRDEATIEEVLASVAREFGAATTGTPYLRSALNRDKMSAVTVRLGPHRASQILTGTMFDLFRALIKHYKEEPAEDAPDGSGEGARRPKTPAQALQIAAEWLARIAVQPLDLLPPVDVTFRDYARAVCRAHQLANPVDPNGHFDTLLKVFRDREIFSDADVTDLRTARYLFDRMRLSVSHDVDELSRSRAAAYRFLDDNREDLGIPAFQDFVVADLYDANKSDRQRMPLPRQIVLEYVWREDVPLDGPQFGRYQGQTTQMLCGGTLVLDDNGNVLAWATKPGTQRYGKPNRQATQDSWARTIEEGRRRRDAFLESVAAQIAAGRVGIAIGTEKGLLGTRVPPLTAESDGAVVQFRLSPHLHLSEDAHTQEEEDEGGRQWEISC